LTIDVLLQNGPIPLPLHLGQPVIDIDLLLCSTKKANQQRKDSFREHEHVLGNKFFSTPFSTKTAPKSYAVPRQLSYSSPLPPPDTVPFVNDRIFEAEFLEDRFLNEVARFEILWDELVTMVMSRVHCLC
jgi:hypothetical protein